MFGMCALKERRGRELDTWLRARSRFGSRGKREERASRVAAREDPSSFPGGAPAFAVKAYRQGSERSRTCDPRPRPSPNRATRGAAHPSTATSGAARCSTVHLSAGHTVAAGAHSRCGAGHDRHGPQPQPLGANAPDADQPGVQTLRQRAHRDRPRAQWHDGDNDDHSRTRASERPQSICKAHVSVAPHRQSAPERRMRARFLTEPCTRSRRGTRPRSLGAPPFARNPRLREPASGRGVRPRSGRSGVDLSRCVESVVARSRRPPRPYAPVLGAYVLPYGEVKLNMTRRTALNVAQTVETNAESS
jgi:hypothetical protein